MRKTRNKDTVLGVSEGGFVSRPPSLFRRGTTLLFFLASVVLNAALWILTFLFVGVGEATVVLRYNAYFGIDLTGSAWQGFLVPFVTTVFFAMNTLMAFLFVRKGVPFLGIFLMIASFFVHIAALIAVAALILVN